MLRGHHDCREHAAKDRQDTSRGLTETESFILVVDVDSVFSFLTTSGFHTDADDAGNHEEDANQVERTDFLAKLKVEDDDVNDACKRQQGRDNALIETAGLGKLPADRHGEKIQRVG